jgi:hypothetical protein
METDLSIVRTVSRNINQKDFSRNIFEILSDFLFLLFKIKKKRHHFIFLLAISMVVFNLVKVPSSNMIPTCSKKLIYLIVRMEG